MIKKYLITVVAILIAFTVLDFVIHGVLLGSLYEATAELWRPREEMNSLMPLMSLVNLVAIMGFTAIYALLIKPRSLGIGLNFGLLYGLAGGVGMGFGTYLVMPIPLALGMAWFAGAVVYWVVAGAIAGSLIPSQNVDANE